MCADKPDLEAEKNGKSMQEAIIIDAKNSFEAVMVSMSLLWER